MECPDNQTCADTMIARHATEKVLIPAAAGIACRHAPCQHSVRMEGMQVKRVRRATREVRAGSLAIGGDSPVSIQSMTSVPLEDLEGTVRQVGALAAEGADLVRVAVRNVDVAKNLRALIASSPVPLCADIHFDYRIALAAIDAGISKVRINPGNIGDSAKVREVVKAAGARKIPIRVGVNAGSVDRKRFPEVTPGALVESALEHVVILEDNGFADIVVSLKSSDMFETIEANRLFAQRRDYPLHIGLTEAGYGTACLVQSSIAIGHLLLGGIGDTIRVSMTGDPVQEVTAAKRILESLGERFTPVRIISCPTCGRTDPGVDMLELARTVESEITARFGGELRSIGRTAVVAVMGCEVNGPGEASHADAGLAGGRGGRFLMFARGKRIGNVSRQDAVRALGDEIEKLMEAWRKE